MIKKLLFFLIPFSMSVFADSTISMKLLLTDENVSVSSFDGAAGTLVTYADTNKYIKVVDMYPDFSNYRLQDMHNEARNGALRRTNSLFSIKLTGVNTKNEVTLDGKIIKTRINLSVASGATWNNPQNTGCLSLLPTNDGVAVNFNEITASSVFKNQCIGKPVDKQFPSNVRISSGERELIVDISPFFINKALPPDSYIGSVVYNGDGWQMRTSYGSASYYPKLAISLTVEKTPYFSGLTLDSSELNLLVNNHSDNDGYRVSGRASTNFTLLGMFSAQDKIKIDARSANNFRLTAAGGASIPYSVGVTYRGVTTPLVVAGNKQSPVILSPGLLSSAVAGSLAFDFSTPASQVHNGMFSDNFTLMAELVL